jgi:hypothetical protein
MNASAMADDFGNISFRFVFARDFPRALSAAEEAIAISPGAIWIRGNQAHALMFLGRAEEARDICRKYRGSSNVIGELSFEQTILGDFSDFRAAGLSSP